MTVFMVAAAGWAVVQLLLLSLPVRSVRSSVILLGFVVGVYGCGVLTFALEFAYITGAASVRNETLGGVAETAAFTVDPVIEELIKVTPLLVAGLSVRTRFQWGFTDYLVLGGSVGAGFGLLEAMARFGTSAGEAIPYSDGGWVPSASLNASYIPGPIQLLAAWLPNPFGSLDVAAFDGPTVGLNVHLVWTALAGLGVGVLFRARGLRRLLGVLLIAVAAVHHMGYNFELHDPDAVLAAPVRWLNSVMWAIPIVCLVITFLIDRRMIRAGKRASTDLLLESERAGASSRRALTDYAVLRMPWTVLIVLRYVRLRRSVCFADFHTEWNVAHAGKGIGGTVSASAQRSTRQDPLRQIARDARTDIDATDHEQAWRFIDGRRVRAARRGIRAGLGPRWPVVVIVVLVLLPAFAFVIVGSFPDFADLQGFMASPAGLWVACGAGAIGFGFLCWRLVSGIRAMRAIDTLGDLIALSRLRVVATVGAMVASAALATRALTEWSPEQSLLPDDAHLWSALAETQTIFMFWLSSTFLIALVPPSPGAPTSLSGPTSPSVPTMPGTPTMPDTSPSPGASPSPDGPTLPASEADVREAAALGSLGTALMQLAQGRGDGSGGNGRHPPARLDKTMQGLRPTEQRTADRLAQDDRFRGRIFRKPDRMNPSERDIDWVDDLGRTYGSVGGGAANQPGDLQRLLDQVDSQLSMDVDHLVLDMTDYSPAQIARVEQHLANVGPDLAQHMHKLVKVGF